MRNIWRIFTGDLKKIHRNTIAVLVMIGLVIVPSLYAWFNIAASWDPYSSTGALKVAVASEDKGYEGELFPVNLNLGDRVISELRANSQLEWVFTDKKEAVEGVKSGSYYAAIVLPEDFSRNLMSLFTENVRHSEIIYYLNEKENAIAPKITDKGADSVQKKIDETFAKTVTEVAAGAAQGVAEFVKKNNGEEGIYTILQNMASNLDEIQKEVKSASDTVKAYADVTSASASALKLSASMLEGSEKAAENGKTIIDNAGRGIVLAASAADGASEGLAAAFDELEKCSGEISARTDEAFDSLQKDAQTGKKILISVADETEKIADKYAGISDSLRKLQSALPQHQGIIYEVLGGMISKVTDIEEQNRALSAELREAAEKTDEGISAASEYREKIKNMIAETGNSLENVSEMYEKDVKAEMHNLMASLRTAGGSVSGLLAGLEVSAEDVRGMMQDGESGLLQLGKSLRSTADLMDDVADRTGTAAEKIRKAAEKKDLKLISGILSENPEETGEYIAAPVRLDEHKFYPVENYGSAMAPFYSVLSIWVGGIIMVALLKVNVDDKRRKELTGLRNHHMYFGRYMIFMITGILQSVLICLGDLYYLGIQCEHPFMFVVAGIFTSIVFVNIIYTLTVSFGDIGKAICVVLLVIQVAGSGGTFPVEMTPSFFQKVYLLLPFTHGMAAMREAVAGFYGNTFGKEMLWLSVFLLFSLLLGLVLRKPVVKLNEKFTKRLEDTKLM